MLESKDIVKALSDVYQPGNYVLLFTDKEQEWSVEAARKVVDAMERLAYNGFDNDSHPEILEGIPLHPMRRDLEGSGRLIVMGKDLHIGSEYYIWLLNESVVEVLMFVGCIPQGVSSTIPKEGRSTLPFVGMDMDDVYTKIPFLTNARPDIADPQFMVSGWVSSIRENYYYFAYHQGSGPSLPQRLVPIPIPGEPPSETPYQKYQRKRMLRYERDQI